MKNNLHAMIVSSKFRDLKIGNLASGVEEKSK